MSKTDFDFQYNEDRNSRSLYYVYGKMIFSGFEVRDLLRTGWNVDYDSLPWCWIDKNGKAFCQIHLKKAMTRDERRKLPKTHKLWLPPKKP